VILLQIAVTRWGTFREPFSTGFADRFAWRYLPAGTTTEGREKRRMAQDLAYDMMLEVQGLIRSLAVRTTLNRELLVGETFNFQGRDWVVERVQPVASAELDRRVVAREVASESLAA
jgi:hypothetical protein